jgi:hypothetical protein
MLSKRSLGAQTTAYGTTKSKIKLLKRTNPTATPRLLTTRGNSETCPLDTTRFIATSS